MKLVRIDERELVFDDETRVEVPDECEVYVNGKLVHLELPRTKRRKLIPIGSDENFCAVHEATASAS